jgi:1-acyl-sn-glycerol-3-phosphate acyltransferase
MQDTTERISKENSKAPSHGLALNIFGRIWAAWALVTFITSFLIIFIPSMLSYLFRSEKRGQDYFIWVSRCWMKVWLRIIGCPVTVTGKEHFKPGATYIVVYNHNALLDVPLSAPYIPAGNKTIAKASFAKVPVFGMFYKRGSVLVDRNNDKSRRKSYDDMLVVLQKGMHMCLYPEGTRNRTNEPLKPFYDGAFRLAIDSKKEIIPGVIIGMKRAMPIDKKFFLLPTKLTMNFLPAVAPGNMKTRQLKDKVYNIMLDYYVASENLEGNTLQ